MVPQGPPTPLGGGQPVPSSLLRSSSGLMGGQGVGLPLQNSFSSLVSPRNQFNNVSMLSNNPNVASLLHQSFGNGGSGAGASSRGLIDGGVEPDPLSGTETGVGFNQPSSSFVSTSVTAIPNSSCRVQGQQQISRAVGNQMFTNQQRSQQIDPQDSEHNQQQLQQYSVPSNLQEQSLSKQQQFHPRNGLGGAGPVKLESPVTNEQVLQLQNLRNLGPGKMDPQQLQSMRSLGPVKMEPQNSDPSLFLQQQQQQLLLPRQSPQAAAAAQILHQQRLMQLQHQQLLKSMSQQTPPLPQFQQQNLPLRPPVKPVYEPGMCARRLQHYMYQQQHRPEDNNIEFWRKFVEEYFAPNAKKKWCVSMYGSGRQTTGVFPQDVWHCEICNRRPGRGFEATVEVLPRLFRIKYESGTLEELLYVDMPREYQNSFGHIVLDYAKAIQESVFEQLRVIREGQLRIVFSPDLKICSWEFCARRHDELIPRKLLIPQVSQLSAAAQKCQAATRNASSSNSVSELQNDCNMFVASARQLAKALEVPLVNDLGYTKRYVRCLQISEVVNSMTDLIDYSHETGMGPMESLTKFPLRMVSSSGSQGQSRQPETHVQHKQQTMGQNSKNDPNNQPNMNDNMNMLTTSSAGSTPVGLLHQNSFNSRQQNLTGVNSPIGSNNVQMLSPGSSNVLLQPQPAPSPYHSPAPALSNNRSLSHGVLSGTHVTPVATPSTSMQQPSPSGDATDAVDSQSSVQKILREMTMSYELGGVGMMGNSMKTINGMLPAGTNTGNYLSGNGVANGNACVGSAGFGGIANGIISHPATVYGSDSSMNGRGGMAMTSEQCMNQQHLLGSANHLLSGLGAGNGFDDLQFDWKTSP